jgi:hypothetical protein
MLCRIISIMLGASLISCAVTPPPDTAQLPFAAFGTLDNDVAAANVASAAFAVPARTANDPVDGARACAAVDFLAGELSSNPRWVMMSPFTKQEMLQARVDVRAVLGVAPGAPSQMVVTALLQFANAWEAGDQAAALRALSAPAFLHPPAETLRILSNLPYIATANRASLDAANQVLPGGDTGRR